MKEFSISKYNPDFRDSNGVYLNDEWIYLGEIGQEFNGRVFTIEEYIETESKYIASIFAVLEQVQITQVKIVNLDVYEMTDNESGKFPIDFSLSPDEIQSTFYDGKMVSGEELVKILKSCLREDCWCCLEGKNNFFIYFAHDYYVYVGGDGVDPSACEFPDGIYVIEAHSPINRDKDT